VLVQERMNLTSSAQRVARGEQCFAAGDVAGARALFEEAVRIVVPIAPDPT